MCMIYKLIWNDVMVMRRDILDKTFLPFLNKHLGSYVLDVAVHNDIIVVHSFENGSLEEVVSKFINDKFKYIKLLQTSSEEKLFEILMEVDTFKEFEDTINQTFISLDTAKQNNVTEDDTNISNDVNTNDDGDLSELSLTDVFPLFDLRKDKNSYKPKA